MIHTNIYTLTKLTVTLEEDLEKEYSETTGHGGRKLLTLKTRH